MLKSKVNFPQLFSEKLLLPGRLSPGALDLVKLVALLAMILDHFNTIFLRPGVPEFYAIGRMAFPLFLMVWAVNTTQRPERLQKRANRIWIWALLAQPAFYLAFRDIYPWYAPNILFVFAGVTQLFALDHDYGRPGVIAGGILLSVMLYPLSLASYSIQGLILALALAVLKKIQQPGNFYCFSSLVYT